MAHISKNILAVLMIATVIISVFGVWITLLVATGQLKVPVSPGEIEGSGEVSVYVRQDAPLKTLKPSENTAEVSVLVK
jgi:hypothetical protein